jgi:hypothetical protein
MENTFECNDDCNFPCASEEEVNENEEWSSDSESWGLPEQNPEAVVTEEPKEIVKESAKPAVDMKSYESDGNSENEESESESESESWVLLNVNNLQAVQNCTANQIAKTKINKRDPTKPQEEIWEETLKADSEGEEEVNISTFDEKLKMDSEGEEEMVNVSVTTNNKKNTAATDLTEASDDSEEEEAKEIIEISMPVKEESNIATDEKIEEEEAEAEEDEEEEEEEAIQNRSEVLPKKVSNDLSDIRCGLVLYSQFGARLGSVKKSSMWSINIPLGVMQESEGPLETAIRAFKECTGFTKFDVIAILKEVLTVEKSGEGLILLFPAYIELDNREFDEERNVFSDNNLEWISTADLRGFKSNIPKQYIVRSFNLLEHHKREIRDKILEENVEVVELATQIFVDHLATTGRKDYFSKKEIKSFFLSNSEDLKLIFDYAPEDLEKMRRKMVVQLPQNEESNLYLGETGVLPKSAVSFNAQPDFHAENVYFDPEVMASVWNLDSRKKK